MSALARAIAERDYDRAALRLIAGLLRTVEASPAAREELVALLTPARPGHTR